MLCGRKYEILLQNARAERDFVTQIVESAMIMQIECDFESSANFYHNSQRDIQEDKIIAKNKVEQEGEKCVDGLRTVQDATLRELIKRVSRSTTV